MAAVAERRGVPAGCGKRQVVEGCTQEQSSSRPAPLSPLSPASPPGGAGARGGLAGASPSAEETEELRMMLAQAQRENRVLESTVNEQLEVNEQYKSTSNALQAELRAAHVRIMEVEHENATLATQVQGLLAEVSATAATPPTPPGTPGDGAVAPSPVTTL